MKLVRNGTKLSLQLGSQRMSGDSLLATDLALSSMTTTNTSLLMENGKLI